MSAYNSNLGAVGCSYSTLFFVWVLILVLCLHNNYEQLYTKLHPIVFRGRVLSNNKR
jgi:hypothetical protein